MQKKSVLLLSTLLLGSAAITANAQSPVPAYPRTISFQGALADAAGNAVPDGVHAVRLAIYADSTGGAPLFVESHTVPVVRGIFNAIIGSSDVAGIPTTVPFDQQYYLGVTVDGGVELAPRIAFTSVPYAFNAANAQVAQVAV